MIETFPLQYTKTPHRVAKEIYLRAYEVYRELYGEQEALIVGSCRGGFSGGELIAFLYAYPFPKDQWRDKVNLVFKLDK